MVIHKSRGDLLSNHNKRSKILLIVILLLIPATVSAVVLPPTEPEFQNIKILTNLDVTGSMSQETELQWELSNEILGGNLVAIGDPPEWVIEPEPPLSPLDEEVQSYVTYSEDTQANLGKISFTKDSEIDTKAKVGAQYNVQTDRLITFTGIGAGSLLSTEDMMMYNVGKCTWTSCICPFCTGGLEPNPRFCSRVEAGSDLAMTKVAAYTSTGIRNVNKAGDMGSWPIDPTADEPARARYLVQVNEMGSGVPSEGAVATTLKISETDGRSEFAGCPFPFQEIRVEESRSINGKISLFDYLITYESGVNI